MATATVDAPVKDPVMERVERRLGRLREMLATKQQERVHAHTTEQARKCDIEAEQFADAISIYEEALSIPAVLTQFGSYKSAQWSTAIPPGLDEFRDMPGRVIQANYYRVQTSDPVAIATLRRLAKQGGLDGTLTEMEVGLMPFIGPNGRFSRWGSAADYTSDKAAGMLRDW